MDVRFLAAIGVLLVLRAILPEGQVAAAVVLGANALGVPAYWWGIRTHQPDASVWYPLGSMLVLMLVSDVLDVAGFPVIANALHLLGYGAAACAAVRLLRRRGSGGDREGLVDAGILTTGAAIVLWQLVIQPNLVGLAPGSTEWLNAVFPLLDVALFGFIARLLLAPGTRVLSLWHLVTALAFALAGDLGRALTHVVVGTSWLDVLDVAARAFVTAAVLTPSVRDLTRRQDQGDRHLQPLRLMVLTVCLLALAVMMAIHNYADNPDWSQPALVLGPPTIAVLMLLRLGGVVRDHERARRQLAEQALHDALTGLPNRRLLEERVAAALARADAHPESVAVLFCDLDRFKLVNDSLGHAAGDELLRQMATRLRDVLRPVDTLARVGGDEFVACVEDVLAIGGAEAMARRLAEAVRAPFRLPAQGGADGPPLFVSASVGVVVGMPGGDAATLLQQADAAMYAAKRHRPGSAELYRDELLRPSASRLELEHELRATLAHPERDELRLYMQEIFDLGTGALVRHEALVRWDHPVRGLLGPAEFVPLAEESDLILTLGAWVLERACGELATRREAAGGNVPGVSVNVSPRQFRDRQFVDLVARTLVDHDLPPQLLCLEITENLLSDDLTEALPTLAGLSHLGVQLALDDFGAGSTSLAFLKAIPRDLLTILKIDRAFISGLLDDPTDRAIVAATITLARSLGLEVVAEGIELAEQRDVLRDLGCGQGQGFLLGRPRPLPPPVPALPFPSRL